MRAFGGALGCHPYDLPLAEFDDLAAEAGRVRAWWAGDEKGLGPTERQLRAVEADMRRWAAESPSG